jgi:hypothetical protein
MVYKTQNHWVFELCPSSRIPKKKKLRTQTFRKLDVSFLRWGWETPTLLGPLEKANPNHSGFLEYRTMGKVQKSSKSEGQNYWTKHSTVTSYWWLRFLKHWDRGFESHPRHGSSRFFCVCVVIRRQLPLIQGVLPPVYKIHNFIINYEWEEAR